MPPEDRRIILGIEASVRTDSPRYPPAAEDQIVLIKHRRLARRDRALWRRELHFHLSTWQWGHRGGCAGVIVTNLHHRLQRPVRRVEGNPVTAVGNELVPVERGIISHYHPVPLGAEFVAARCNWIP